MLLAHLRRLGTGGEVGCATVWTSGRLPPRSERSGRLIAILGGLGAAFAGDPLGVWTGVALGVIVVGVVLAARPQPEADESGHDDPRAALFGLAAACTFGAGLYATGRASLDLPIAWAVLPPRLLGVVLVTVPLVALGRLRLTRAAAP